MKILAIKADNSGCGKYRIEEPARVARSLGVEVEVDTGVDAEAYENKSSKIVTVREIYTDADCIILQRPLNNSSLGLIRQAKKQGIATIVEMDDDLAHVSGNNIAYRAMYGESHTNVDWVLKSCMEADLVTVSTLQLSKYAPHGRVSVLKNYVPESILSIPPRYESVDLIETIGWSGSTQTHPHDLQTTKGRINQVVSKNGLNFSVVGDGKNVQRFLNLTSSTSFTKTGWVHVDDYYTAMVNTMDIGIVPLELSSFNESKSHLKGIEMAALGIPFVASPTREYVKLEAHGVGKVARSTGEWSKHLQRWVDRPSDYQRDAQKYRDNIAENFTYEQHAQEWVDAWSKAIDYRKKHNV